MKTNVFSIPKAKVGALKSKFTGVGLEVIHSEAQEGWNASFYFSKNEEPSQIPWVETFSSFFGEDEEFKNLIYFGAYIFEKNDKCFVLSFGKTHFYIRPFCEYDFGVEMAKRIANESDIKQTSSKKFAGKKKKEIKSYTRNSKLDIESGESVDYLQAAVIESYKKKFGRSGKFGSSILINPAVGKQELGKLLDDIVTALATEEQFKLPRTVAITEESEIAKYDGQLLTAIKSSSDSTDFTENGHDLVGVDFVFAGNEKYTLYCVGYDPQDCEQLDLTSLNQYITANSIADADIFDIKIKIENEGQRPYSKTLKEALDYIVDDENVMLTQGGWVRFNEDYLTQLNDYIDSIEVEVAEDQFKEIALTETAFNASEEVREAGYVVADKDFSKINIGTSTPIEAWDLQKGNTVYAVKFATSQKIGYVCDQATAVAEIIRSKSNLKKLDQNVQSYCLWLGFDLTNPPAKISESGSIILKQKIEAWARKCREIGVEPKLKISRKVTT